MANTSTDATAQAQANMPASGDASAETAPAKPVVTEEKGSLAAYEPTRTVVTEEDQKVKEAAEAEQKMRTENPNLVIVREADPALGGHSFDYGQPPVQESKKSK